MNKTLKLYCKNSSYNKIYKALSKGELISGFFRKNHQLTDAEKKLLENYIEASITEQIYSNKNVPWILFKISEKFDKSFITRIKLIVSSYVIPKVVSDLSKQFDVTFKTLSDLNKCYKILEDSENQIKSLHNGILLRWDFDFLFLKRAKDIIFSLVSDKIHLSKNTTEEIFFGLNYTIRFEISRNENFLECNCSNNGECIHLSRISNLFIPKINLYLDYCFSTQNFEIKYDQRNYEQNIIKYFIVFFRKVEQLIVGLKYFNNQNVFSKLYESIDTSMLKILENLVIETSDIEKSCMLLNTLNFINIAFMDLNSNYSLSINPHNFKSVSKLSKIEELQIKQLQKSISKKLIQKSTKKFSVSIFLDFLKLDFEKVFRFDQFIIKTLLEILIGKYYVEIRKIKLTEKNISEMIFGMCEIESYLLKKVENVPCFSNIKIYIKMISCPLDNPKNFIENFLLFSNDPIVFNGVLELINDKIIRKQLKNEFLKIFK